MEQRRQSQERASAKLAPLSASAMLDVLGRPATFGLSSGEQARPVVKQTHGSMVALVGPLVYKVKKPVNLGFLDYSTPARRRRACLAESRLNARLAHDVYLGVAPLIARPHGGVSIGPIIQGAAIPLPHTTVDGGQVIDYAVVMRRLPEETTLAARLAMRSLDATTLTHVARRLAAFHAHAPHGSRVARYGAREATLTLWRENFEQMRFACGSLFDTQVFDRVQARVEAFAADRASLFDGRLSAGRIRDGHGDLRLEHIYTFAPQEARAIWGASPVTSGVTGDLEGQESDAERVEVVDCIEFSPRYRFADVAAEIAFPVMELDAAGRPDLGRAFADAYIAASGDEHIRELLPYYLSYRATVRAKVSALLAREPEVSADERRGAERAAGELFALASEYAEQLHPRKMTLVGGLSGSGKSALAHRLAHTLGWPMQSSDHMRKRLAGLPAEQPQPEAYKQGLYSDTRTRQVYHALAEQARESLVEGHSVLVDATFGRRTFRQEMARMAADMGVRAIFLECVCTLEVALGRLHARWRRRVALEGPSVVEDSRASDARPEIYHQQVADWEPFDAAEEPAIERIVIETAAPEPAVAETALARLGYGSRRVCWLS